MAQDRRKQGAVERHVQTILLSLVTAGILALATFVWNTNAAIVRFEASLNSVGRDLAAATNALQNLASTAETKADHERDLGQVKAVQSDHEVRIRSLEQSLGRGP